MLKVGIPAFSTGLKVEDVMSTDVTFLQADQSLDDAWQILHAKSISGAPVLDSKGRLVGIASKADLADPRRRAGDGSSAVRDAMTRVIYAVRYGNSIMSAVKLMIDEDIHRAIVLHENGSIAGIVTPMDVLRAFARGEHIEASAQGSPVKFVDVREIG